MAAGRAALRHQCVNVVDSRVYWLVYSGGPIEAGLPALDDETTVALKPAPLCVGIAPVCVYRPISGGVCTMDSSRQTTTRIASPAATNMSDSQPLLLA